MANNLSPLLRQTISILGGAAAGVFGFFLIAFILIQLFSAAPSKRRQGVDVTQPPNAPRIVSPQSVTNSSRETDFSAPKALTSEAESKRDAASLGPSVSGAGKFAVLDQKLIDLVRILDSSSFTLTEMGDAIDAFDGELKALGTANAEDEESIYGLANLLKTSVHDWGFLVFWEEELLAKERKKLEESISRLKRNEKLIQSSKVLSESLGNEFQKGSVALEMLDRGYLPLGELDSPEEKAKVERFKKSHGINVEEKVGFGWVVLESSRRILRAKCLALSKGIQLTIHDPQIRGAN